MTASGLHLLIIPAMLVMAAHYGKAGRWCWAALFVGLALNSVALLAKS